MIPGLKQRQWCATCNPKAKKPGDVGYCGSDALDNEAEAPKMQKNSTNWGYCDIRCSAHEQNQMFNYLHVCSKIQNLDIEVVFGKLRFYDSDAKTNR